MAIQEKAKAALAARDAKDFRWLQLIFRLVPLTVQQVGRALPPASCDGTRCPSRNNCLRHEEPGNGPKAASWARREPGATACDQYRAVKVLTTFKEPSQ